MKSVLTMALAMGLVTFFGCKQSTTTNNSSQTYSTGTMPIGTGTARTWVTMDASGKLSAIGVTLSDAALASLGNTDTSFMLPVPSAVSTEFKAVMLDYATHDPAPYNHPHIDPHFFLIDTMAMMNIMGGMDTMAPMSMMFPSGYACNDSSEMMMGDHWIDTTAPEFHNQPFLCSLAYGTTMGNLDFMELMCDKASLDGQKTISGTVRRPTAMMGMMMSTTFPATYKVSYDGTAKSTTIELDGFDQ